MRREVKKGASRREPSKELDKLAHDVIGAALEVHRVLGPGFLESVYEEAIFVELRLHGMPFLRQPIAGVNYKGHRVGQGRMDLPVGDVFVVEPKTVDALAPAAIRDALLPKLLSGEIRVRDVGNPLAGQEDG